MEFSYADVRAARDVVARHLPPTPMWSYPVLNAEAGATVFVKHENVQPVGAFKVRGGLTLLDGMPAADRERGTVTYSTGNHAQSLAYAGQIYGVKCTVVMPAGTDPAKAAAVEAWGGSVVLTGAGLDAAEEYAQWFAAETGARLVSPADTPELLAGVGTLYAEVLEAEPGLDVIVVPVGSGTGPVRRPPSRRDLHRRQHHPRRTSPTGRKAEPPARAGPGRRQPGLPAGQAYPAITRKARNGPGPPRTLSSNSRDWSLIPYCRVFPILILLLRTLARPGRGTASWRPAPARPP